MTRVALTKIHLYFSGIILIFLSMTALSGALHLLVGDEAEVVRVAKQVEATGVNSKEELTSLFEKELAVIDSKYQFDYIKGSSSSQTSRPTTRKFYTIKLDKGFAKIEEHNPSLIMSLMELHKGHGPRSSRNILGILGILVLGAIFSGLWLGISSKTYRKVTLATIFSGAFIYLLMFNL